jgi:transcriptional regulator with XRE-family HTH domain
MVRDGSVKNHGGQRERSPLHGELVARLIGVMTEDEINAAFRESLRTLLDVRQVAPATLSKKVGRNPKLVENILTGTAKSPKLSTAALLAAELQVSIDEMITGVPRSRIDPAILRLLAQYPAEQQWPIVQLILQAHEALFPPPPKK